MRNRYLLDILVLGLLIASGSALAPARSSFSGKQTSVVWGSITSVAKIMHSSGGRG